MTSSKNNSYSHDTSYRLLFSQPEMIRDLIKGFVPDEDLKNLDFSTLETVAGHFATDHLNQRITDVIWRVKVNEEWLYLYILIEFQSSVNRYMALRMMVYIGLLYQQLIDENKVLSNGQLPPVLPIVLYNGLLPWSAPQNVVDLIPEMPHFLKQFSPSMKYFLIDENAFEYDDLDQKQNLVALVFQLEHPSSVEKINGLIDKLDELIPKKNHRLRHIFMSWIPAIMKVYGHLKEVLPKLESLKELSMTLEQVLRRHSEESHMRGIQEGILEGMLKGKIEGEKHTLCRLLTKRFGELPLDISKRIENADSEQIETWLDAVLDAKSLYEVFESLH